MEYASVSITAQEFAQWTYAMYTSDTFRILAYPELYLLGIFRHTQGYSELPIGNSGLFQHIQHPL